jgi:hypothetical protein
MKIYIYKEAAGSGLVVVKSENKPAENINIATVNGEAIPANRNAFVLLDTVTQINNCFNSTDKDYKTIRDAMKAVLLDLGGTVEAGFDLLDESEQAIAAQHNLGTGAQIASAIPNVLLRDQYSLLYLNNLKTIVRPERSRKLEAKTWSRCKQFNIEVSSDPLIFATMPEVIYSNITINDPNAAAGELGGNMLVYYEDAGVMGFYSGDKTLGILDYLYSTTGTRFAGAGFTEIFASIVPDGYANITAFRDALADIIVLGELDQITTVQ